MGLLATFDLDFVMTSEREWGCYPDVPGLAIYQLCRPGGHPGGPRQPLGVGRAGEGPGGTAASPDGRGRRREPPVRGHRSAVVSQPATAPDLERLHRLLADKELRWLVERIRTRLERGLALDGTVALEPATAAQRRAVARLLGRPIGRGASLHVSLRAVEAVLQRGGLAPDLAWAVPGAQWSGGRPPRQPRRRQRGLGQPRSPPPSRYSSATPR